MPDDLPYLRIYRVYDFLDEVFDDLNDDKAKTIEDGLTKIIADLNLQEEFEVYKRRSKN